MIGVLGNSITFGAGVRMNESWPALLQAQLRRSYPNVHVLNGAVRASSADFAALCWDDLWGAQWRYTGGRVHSPQLDLVLIDYSFTSSPGQLAALVDKVLSLSPQPAVAATVYCPHQSWQRVIQTSSVANRRLWTGARRPVELPLEPSVVHTLATKKHPAGATAAGSATRAVASRNAADCTPALSDEELEAALDGFGVLERKRKAVSEYYRNAFRPKWFLNQSRGPNAHLTPGWRVSGCAAVDSAGSDRKVGARAAAAAVYHHWKGKAGGITPAAETLRMRPAWISAAAWVRSLSAVAIGSCLADHAKATISATLQHHLIA